MSIATAVVGDTVQYRNSRGGTRNATVLATQPAAPVAGDFSVANSNTGGTLGAATYSYKITQVVNGVESAPVASAKTTVVGSGSTNKCTISLPNATATSIYRVYGRTGGSELLIAQTTAGDTSYIDTGAITPAGALTTADGRVRLFNPSGGLKGDLASVDSSASVTAIKAATIHDTNAYFKRT